MSHQDIAIKCDHVTFKYSDAIVLEEVSFSVNQGEKIGIIGLNGSGKSTLLKLIVGLLKNKQGIIEVLNQPVVPKNLKQIYKSVGYVFQNIDEQLFMPTVRADIGFGIQGRYPQNEVEEKVQAVIKRFEIDHLSDKAPFELSGGEKRTVAIATVMVMEPKLILMDEPTEGLDSRMRRKMQNFILDAKETFLMSSHDEKFVRNVCDRVLVLDHGKVVRYDTPDAIYGDKTFLKTYDLDD